MGMIVTLYLISANVYNSVDAPKGRRFSYIELWMLGSQCPILLALCEYGFVLYLKVEKILEDSLDSVPSPSPSVKIQIMGGTVCFKV